MIEKILKKIHNNKNSLGLTTFTINDKSQNFAYELFNIGIIELEKYSKNIYDELKQESLIGTYQYYKTLRKMNYKVDYFHPVQNDLMNLLESKLEIHKNPFELYLYNKLARDNFNLFLKEFWINIFLYSKFEKIENKYGVIADIVEILHRESANYKNVRENSFLNIFIIDDKLIQYISKNKNIDNYNGLTIAAISDQSLIDKKIKLYQFLVFENANYFKSRFGGNFTDGNKDAILIYLQNISELLKIQDPYVVNHLKNKNNIEKENLYNYMKDCSTEEKIEVVNIINKEENLKNYCLYLQIMLENDIMNDLILPKNKILNKNKKF